VHRRDEIRASRISEPPNQSDACAVGECEKSNDDGLLGRCAVAGGEVRSNGRDEPGLSDYRIRQFARNLKRAESDRQRTGTIRNKELDDSLRAALAQEGVFPEFVGVEVDRVMAAVFGADRCVTAHQLAPSNHRIQRSRTRPHQPDGAVALKTAVRAGGRMAEYRMHGPAAQAYE
jgi:hypothetical protein